MTRHNNSTQSFKSYSTRDLCKLVDRLNINYCAKFFEKEKVDGKEMLHFTKEEFVSMLKTNTGEFGLLVSYSVLRRGSNYCWWWI